jgi:ATP-binding cassette subfamily F protein uup
MRLLMGGPNVLLLDEPTNDLDVDTLTALEDLLDGWPGTLVVVSHDRYFVERVCDDVYALTDGGQLRHLPRGIEQYIEERRGGAQPRDPTLERRDAGANRSAQAPGAPAAHDLPAGARIRAERKQTQRSERELARLERAIEQSAEREQAIAEQMTAAATDHAELVRLQSELEQLLAEREQLETSWLETSEALEG